MAAWSTDQSNDMLLHSPNRPTGDRWLKVNIQCFKNSRVYAQGVSKKLGLNPC